MFTVIMGKAWFLQLSRFLRITHLITLDVENNYCCFEKKEKVLNFATKICMNPKMFIHLLLIDHGNSYFFLNRM